jgi:molybdopterin-guanine dinucleotide biosynthesis protein A
VKSDVSNNVTGYILAGGQSSRMGIDKRWIKIGHETIIERIYNLIENVLGEPPVVVSNNPDKRIPSTWEIIPDKIAGKGPLGGLVALLENCGSEWALVLAVDLPYLISQEIDLLLTSTRDGYEVITLSNSGDPEPLVALYNKSTLDFWTQRLVNNELSLHRGIKKLKWKPVLIPIGSQALTNLNTQEDLAKLK